MRTIGQAIILFLLGSTCLQGAMQDPVITWNQLTLQAIEKERTPGPIAARHLAMVHCAIYDAALSVERTYAPFRSRPMVKRETDIETAVASAAYRVLSSLYPDQIADFNAELLRHYQSVIDSGRKKDAISLGREVADEIIAWRKQDHSQEEGKFNLSRRPGDWISTSNLQQQPELPAWERVTPFALHSAQQFCPPAPYEIDSRQYAQDVEMLHQLGGKDSRHRSKEQTDAALFWASATERATCPGCWNKIAQNLAKSRRTSVVQNARLFALLNIAMADAQIASSHCKYSYRRWRPLTAIHYANLDGNLRTRRDLDWEPLIETSLTPEYISSHSACSGAAEVVLTNYFGPNAAVTLQAEPDDGQPRRYESVSAAAQEAGISRVYAGVHFPSSHSQGSYLGQQIGRYVVQNELRPLKTVRR